MFVLCFNALCGKTDSVTPYWISPFYPLTAKLDPNVNLSPNSTHYADPTNLLNPTNPNRYKRRTG